jgi:hypothetical protein
MDEEDMKELKPTIQTKENYEDPFKNNIHMESKQSVIQGFVPVELMNKEIKEKESIGIKLLKKIGWKEGKNIYS